MTSLPLTGFLLLPFYIFYSASLAVLRGYPRVFMIVVHLL